MRILIFGDSITQGFWDPDGGWVQLLKKHFDTAYLRHMKGDFTNVLNLGISNTNSTDLKDSIVSDAKYRSSAKHKTVILIDIGTNDSRLESGKEVIDLEGFKDNISEIHKIAKNYTSKVIYKGLIPCDDNKTHPVAWDSKHVWDNKRIGAFNNVIRDFCVDKDIQFVDTHTKFLASMEQGSDLLADGVHPNKQGHVLIFNVVKDYLEKERLLDNA